MWRIIFFSFLFLVAITVIVTFLWSKFNQPDSVPNTYLEFPNYQIDPDPIDLTGFSFKLKEDGRINVGSLPPEQFTQIARESYILNPDETGFDILYYNLDGNLAVLLYREPIAEVRLAAEAYIKNNFNLSEEDMCNLNASVKTNKYTNVYYANQELGFSFCPGAVQLE